MTSIFLSWRWWVIAALLLAGCRPVAPPPPAVATPDATATIDVIAFGSCARQTKPQPIWDAVLATAPDLFVFLGDNVYGDTTDMAELRRAYALLAAQPGFQRLRATTPVVATWDDHDYGLNDVGGDYPAKYGSREVFLDFWGEPPDSERRLRNGGIYTAYAFGPEERRVQVILLDTRWDRSPLARVSDEEHRRRRAHNIGPYTANLDPDARLLGEDQWAWLEAQLRQPATVRIIATSIPFAQEGTGWEIWANFPAERARLLRLLAETRANGVLFITGDTHRAQFSRLDPGARYPLWEVNSSGLTENVDPDRVAPDVNRYGDYFVGDNFGLITIDWSVEDPTIALEIRAVDNRPVLRHVLRLSELQP
ncbi:MAG: alkaline phosphatase D family protein [Caldilinea sp.]|uniref:alkaline phosphatase D family protein n=1 Tax=Caldilinea sp. TaxID=2293560 RepID=UPI0030B062CD